MHLETAKIKVPGEIRYKLVGDFQQYQQFPTSRAHHFHGRIARRTLMEVSSGIPGPIMASLVVTLLSAIKTVERTQTELSPIFV